MATKAASKTSTGVNKAKASPSAAGSVELFGHCTLVEGYALPNFLGCHAMVAFALLLERRSGWNSAIIATLIGTALPREK